MPTEMDRLNKKKKSPINAYLPVLGLLLTVSLGVISWVLAPSLETAAVSQFSQFQGNELPDPYMQLSFAGFIFLMLMSFAGLVVAAFAPKKKSKVKDTELLNERKARAKEKEMRKRKRAQLSKAAREENKKKTQ